ncbi:MAG: hypothetical protein ABGX16_25050 [Pirellulales bacterium]
MSIDKMSTEKTDIEMTKWVKRINGSERFAYIRVNDGEIKCAMGKSGHNRSKHTFTRPLRMEIQKTLQMKPEPGLFMALGAIGARTTPQVNVMAPHWRDNWSDMEWLYVRIIDGTAWPFIEAIRKRNIILVGPGYFEDAFKDIAPISAFIKVPDRQCFDDHHRIVKKTLSLCTTGDLVLASYSLPSVALGREVWKHGAASFFDCGSIWEPIFKIGKTSHPRSWYRKMKCDPADNLKPSLML